MKACQTCKQPRVIEVHAKCDDRCQVDVGRIALPSNYVPSDLGIGGGDYIHINVCLNCGQLQGKWPLPTSQLETYCQYCSWKKPVEGTHTWQGRPMCYDCWEELQND